MYIETDSTKSDYQWMKSIMYKGTVSDKVAASVVLIQNNPISSLDTIKSLIGMVKVAKKNECITVMGKLKDF